MTEQHANQSTRHFHTAEVRSCVSTLQAQNGSGTEAFWHVNFRNKCQRGIAIFKICFHPKSYSWLCPFISSTSRIPHLHPDISWFKLMFLDCIRSTTFFPGITAVQDCHCFFVFSAAWRWFSCLRDLLGTSGSCITKPFDQSKNTLGLGLGNGHTLPGCPLQKLLHQHTHIWKTNQLCLHCSHLSPAQAASSNKTESCWKSWKKSD